jgi:putative membrane protein
MFKGNNMRMPQLYLAAVLVVSGAALAQTPATDPDIVATSPDAPFYKKAAASGLAEVDGGMLAQQNGKSAAVKAFGEMMVKDHSAANDGLRGLAMIKHVDLALKPDAAQTAKRSALQALSGDAFDRAYIEWQILSHKDVIALFKEESASGDDLDAKQFATSTLPTLKLHLNFLMAMPAPATPAATPAATPPAAASP